jgi:hemophore-related protein
MLFFRFAAPPRVAGGISAGAIAAAIVFGGAGSALADPEPPPPAPVPAPAPPNCTAADLANVAAGVAANTSAYLFAHPDVNDYFTSLKGQPRSDIREQVQGYMDANPQVHADLQAIRQPLVDMQNRCQIVGD